MALSQLGARCLSLYVPVSLHDGCSGKGRWLWVAAIPWGLPAEACLLPVHTVAGGESFSPEEGLGGTCQCLPHKGRHLGGGVLLALA